MKLESLLMQNFMPFRGPHTLLFPQDEVRNVLVVFGDNMRGKTSLLNAIRWVLYGKALGRHLVEIPLPRLVNSEATAQGDWSMSVVLRFIALGSSYVLTRTATKKEFVSTPTRPDDFIVSVFLERDGIVLLADDVDREIAQFAPEQVSRFFLFDGELLQEYETLLIEGSSQGKRIREAIEGVLGVPALALAVEDITTLLRRAQKRQASDLIHVQAVSGLLADQATAQKFGGTGLGLVITQRLIEAMGGSVHVESIEGQGACFTLLVPRGLAWSQVDPRGKANFPLAA